MEFVGCKDGINFYNDSKATNTASTLSAINVLGSSTVLILGGSEKGEDYSTLFEKIKSCGIKHVVITGASKFKMLDCAGKCGYSDVTLTSDFCDAVRIAKVIAQDGDNVLLSPACASFDCFSSYEERGDKFKDLVGEF
jgi:UDP-N-acetylmuramoylalanine--D-glutamate ligase